MNKSEFQDRARRYRVAFRQVVLRDATLALALSKAVMACDRAYTDALCKEWSDTDGKEEKDPT